MVQQNGSVSDMVQQNGSVSDMVQQNGKFCFSSDKTCLKTFCKKFVKKIIFSANFNLST